MAAVVVVVAGVAAGYLLFAGDDAPSTFTARGEMELDGGSVGFDGEGSFFADSGTCFGANGYADISAGAQVTVSDSSGKTVALGELSGGRVRSGACVFDVTVEDVPAGNRFYKVEVTHRGNVQYSEDEMRNGQVSLVLGDS